MPFCPNCNNEYVEGIKVCPDCGADLVSKEDYDNPEEWTEKNWVTIYTCDQVYEAEMLKDNLESAGIPSAILSQKDRNFPAPGDFSTVKVMVNKEDLEAAHDFIEQYKLNKTNNNNNNSIDDESKNE